MEHKDKDMDTEHPGARYPGSFAYPAGIMGSPSVILNQTGSDAHFRKHVSCNISDLSWRKKKNR
jgi:hypothetical protein